MDKKVVLSYPTRLTQSITRLSLELRLEETFDLSGAMINMLEYYGSF